MPLVVRPKLTQIHSLPSLKSNNLNAYCKFTYGKNHLTSKIHYNSGRSLNWNDQLTFNSYNSEAVMWVELFHHQPPYDILIGFGHVALKSLELCPNKKKACTITLITGGVNGVKSGSITITFEFIPSDIQTQNPEFQYSVVIPKVDNSISSKFHLIHCEFYSEKNAQNSQNHLNEGHMRDDGIKNTESQITLHPKTIESQNKLCHKESISKTKENHYKKLGENTNSLDMLTSHENLKNQQNKIPFNFQCTRFEQNNPKFNANNGYSCQQRIHENGNNFMNFPLQKPISFMDQRDPVSFQMPLISKQKESQLFPTNVCKLSPCKSQQAIQIPKTNFYQHNPDNTYFFNEPGYGCHIQAHKYYIQNKAAQQKTHPYELKNNQVAYLQKQKEMSNKVVNNVSPKVNSQKSYNELLMQGMHAVLKRKQRIDLQNRMAKQLMRQWNQIE